MSWYCTAAQFWDKTKNKKYQAYSYQLPLLCDPVNGIVYEKKLPMVCMSAMQLISGRKVSFWCTCMKAVQENTIPKHGLVRKVSNNNKFEAETLDDLKAFFMEIESFCDVVPTRFVREKTSQTTRDDHESLLQLPPYWSKWSLYS
jgi:hypothetical protein